MDCKDTNYFAFSAISSAFFPDLCDDKRASDKRDECSALNHVVPDICDTLAGDYPKDFKWTGWHPHCRCHATSILKTDEELDRDAELMDAGEEPSSESVNAVNELPKDFTKWVELNEKKILEPQKSTPYFLQDNWNDVRQILRIGTNPQSPLEIAEQRHLLRTPVEEQAIRDAWAERNRDPRVIAANRHANRTAVQAQGIRDAWSKHNQEISNIQSTANNVLKLAKDYGEVDYSQLESLVSAGKVNGLQSAYKDVGQQILAAKKFEQSISDIIPDAHQLHKSYSSTELQTTRDEINYRFNRQWAKKYGYNDWNAADPKHLKNKIEWDLSKESAQYSHFPLVEKILKQKLAATEDSIYWGDVQQKLNEQILYYSQHKKYKTLANHIANLKSAITSKDKTAARLAIADFEKKKTSIDASAATKRPSSNISKTKPKRAALVTETRTQNAHQSLGAYYEDYPEEAMDVVLSRTNVLRESLSQFANTEDGKIFSAVLPQMSQLQTVDEIRQFVNVLRSSYTQNPKELIELENVVGDVLKEVKMQARAIGNFTWKWDYEIRQIQCGNAVTSKYGHSLTEMRERAEAVERFIRCSPKWDGGRTYRGMTLSQQGLDNIIDQCKKGECSMLGGASWSTIEDKSRAFARMNVGQLDVDGNRKDQLVMFVTDKHEMATSIVHLSKFKDGEGEVLGSMDERWTYIKHEVVTHFGRDYVYIYVKPA